MNVPNDGWKMELNEEEQKLLAEDPTMINAFMAQDSMMKLLAEWAPRIHAMTEDEQVRWFWAAIDALLCATYRTIPMKRANAVLGLVLNEIRKGNG